jgi:succinate dehydrogenase/fumarate reductase-like Fe-S protein
MAVTSLRRKARRNKTVSRKRTSAIKRLTATPVIKKVVVENGKVTEGAEAAKPGIEPATEAKVEKQEEPKAEKKAPKAKKETAAEADAVEQEEPLKNGATDKE